MYLSDNSVIGGLSRKGWSVDFPIITCVRTHQVIHVVPIEMAKCSHVNPSTDLMTLLMLDTYIKPPIHVFLSCGYVCDFRYCFSAITHSIQSSYMHTLLVPHSFP